MNRISKTLAAITMGAACLASPLAASAATAKAPKAAALKYGIFARLHAKAGKEADLAKFLEAGAAMAAKEAGTVVWYAIKFDEHTFGIFDAFTDEEGRKAHMNGAIAAALGAKAAELLAEPPALEQVDVIGAK